MKEKNKIKVLLIGGTGVLSTDIRELAVKKDYEVYILNRGKNKNKNLNKKVIPIKADIRKVEETKQALEKYEFDIVLDFLTFNLDQLKDNLSIFNKKCKQYIFISSATAYRKTKKGEKITEKYKLENTEWKYARNKIECEEYLKKNYKETGQQYTIIRPYVTYSDTRIPFAVIPHDKQWTLVKRILDNKPIVLWDNGKATCTLTSTKDFAVGVVGLFNNPKAINEDFHITTDYTLTWNEALQYIGKALKKEVIIADIPSKYISEKMPHYKGILFGDKGLDREFDNSKIKAAVPEFNAQIKFEEGIQSTIDFYKKNKYMQELDYEWDARIDKLIKDYYKEQNIETKDLILKYTGDKKKRKDKMIYTFCNNNFLYLVYKAMKKIYKVLVKIL